jgi:flagellin-like hook-associated protein FlgL
MSDISLTASMRSNLLSLQNTSKLMDQTQERLSTGKKVNSAIDNPSSYYTARSLNNRAGDLSALLDSMGQGISTIKAANEGIESITSFVEQAKAVAGNALETTDIESRTKYAAQFDSILDQIDDLAKDSGYKGVNLLKEDNLVVTFNEDRDSQLEIKGVDATYEGLGIEKAGTNWDAVKVTTAPSTSKIDENGKIKADVTANEVLEIKGNRYLVKEAITGGTEAAPLDPETPAVKAKLVKLTKVGDDYYNTVATTDAINDSIEQVMDAINTLRNYASEFGNNYSIVQAREEFTTNLINVLEEGADKLTLADMNEESANMLALQTRQQLAINSLSLASQAAQSVLKLFS